MMTTPHVFISYSQRDDAIANTLCAHLERDGMPCWIAPRDVPPGAEWMEAIISAISECRVMVFVFSADANGSPQVRRELERAIARGKPIVPFRIEAVQPAGAVEYAISGTQWLDALSPPIEPHLQRLSERVRALLGTASTAPGAIAQQTTPRERPPLILAIDHGTTADACTPLYQLRSVEGSRQGETFLIDRERVTIGRSPYSDIVLDDPGISRSHCALVWDVLRREYILVDFRARRPILINGEIMRGEQPLKTGDEIELGKTIMRFERTE